MTDHREVLYTIDRQGKRKWVYADLVTGRYVKARAVVAYILVAFYLFAPWLELNGKQLILFDILQRKFIIFGTTFWATDAFLFALFLAVMGTCLFFFTSLFGRIWCGWACPETVFLEYIFRPIERLIEGGPVRRLRLDMRPWNIEKIYKKALKHGFSALMAWVIASSALAYFYGSQRMLEMMTNWPSENIWPFSMTVVMMGLMGFQFGWFREQFCTVLCPYARFQSVLMDKHSLGVGYDIIRGEPRGKLRHTQKENLGDCIDCGLCVRVCPTGIDIRNGNQLECIHCACCVDACDSVMDSIGRPLGLIRYDTEHRLLGGKGYKLSPRTLLYAVILLCLLLVTVVILGSREAGQYKISRAIAHSNTYTVMPSGEVSNQFNIHVSNRSDVDKEYRFKLVADEEYKLITPLVPLKIASQQHTTAPVFIYFPQNVLKEGRKKIELIVYEGRLVLGKETLTLFGPEVTP